MRRNSPPAPVMPTTAMVVRFEQQNPVNDMVKSGKISATFRINSVRYFQHLNEVIETKEALEMDPMTVHRLLRMRDEREAVRASQKYSNADRA